MIGAGSPTEQRAPVSVVIPCFRCGDTITRAVESVAAQTVMPEELILIDDSSGDETLSTLHDLKVAYPSGWIKLIEHDACKGPATARNSGWNSASQPYIAFLDSDDSWHPRKIELQYGWMSRHPEVVMSGHACGVVLEGNNASPRSHDLLEFPCEPISMARLLMSNRFPTRSVMLNAGIDLRFHDGKRHSEDYLLWLQVCARYGSCALSPATLAYLYKNEYGDGGLSGDLWKMTKGELHTYRELARSGGVSQFGLAPLYLWCMVKHARRAATCRLRGLRRRA